VTQQLGPYRIVRELARGGMGAVYEAVHETTGARYAVKTLLPDVLGDPDERIRFAREARALAEVDHPHIVRIHAAELAGQTPYLVQDLLPGGSLKDRLRDGPLPPLEATQLTIKLTSALAAVHAKGVLHRDLKPDNVLIDDRGEPRLTDFGLAKRLHGESQRLTQTGVIVGTPSYMAPEQASGESMGERTDVYGLGATLYALLCGQPPFPGRNLINILEAVLLRPAPPLPDAVPTALRAVVTRALEKRPEDRFPDMAQFGAALEAALRGIAPPARERRGRWLGALALVGLVGLGLALRWSSGTPGPAPQNEEPGPVPTPVVTQAPPDPTSVAPVWTWIPLSEPALEARYLPDGRVLIRATAWDVVLFDRGGEQVGDGWRMVGRNPTGAGCWEITPSGTLAWSGGRSTRISDPETGRELYGPTPPRKRVDTAAACSSDGTLVLSSGRHLFVFDDHLEQRSFLGDWGGCEVLAFSPSGEWLAHDWGPQGLLKLIRPAKPLAQPGVTAPNLSCLRWSAEGDRLAAGTRTGRVGWTPVGEKGQLEDPIWLLDDPPDDGPILDMQFSPDGRFLVSTTATEALRWDLELGGPPVELGWAATSIDLSPDGPWLLLAVGSWRDQGPGLIQLPLGEVFGR
jgi:Protein kinase domain